MTEKQPIELQPKPDKKGKVIFEAKEPVKKPITKEAYRINALALRDYCVEQIVALKEKIKSIDDTLVKMDEEEARGYIIRPYEEGKNLGYDKQEKPPLGFPRPQTSTKDAGTWNRETQERQTKKG